MTGFETKSFDHVALWVADREPLTELLCERMGMHVIERSEEFTLVGADAREGKLTLFAADGPRQPGVLERIVLRVDDLVSAVARLPRGLSLERRDGEVRFDGPEGVRLGLVEADGLDYDLDHVVLRVPEPLATMEHLGAHPIQHGKAHVGAVLGGVDVHPEGALAEGRVNHLDDAGRTAPA